jgi:hypothetical protein
MKLYTEEQVHSAMLLALGRHGIYIPNNHYQDLIDLLTPFELPSDEEIKKEMEFDWLDPDDVAYLGGAIWMRNKIQGGNDE